MTFLWSNRNLRNTSNRNKLRRQVKLSIAMHIHNHNHPKRQSTTEGHSVDRILIIIAMRFLREGRTIKFLPSTTILHTTSTKMNSWTIVNSNNQKRLKWWRRAVFQLAYRHLLKPKSLLNQHPNKYIQNKSNQSR